MQDVELLFQQVVKLDFSRISARLRLAKKYPIEASPLIQLHKIFLRHSIKIDGLKMEEFRSQLETILAMYRRLKNDPNPQRTQSALEAMEHIIKTSHQMNHCPEFVIALRDLSRSDTSKLEPLTDLIGKLAQYYNASSELVSAARHKRGRLFQRIYVQDFDLRVPDVLRSPSTPDSAQTLIKSLKASPDTSKVLQHFQNSESKAAAALIRRVNGTRSGIKIHAEIKLLFYYEVHSERIKPRMICANKSACYLCDLFVRAHGQFQVPMTFGKLNERWILPDWLDNIQPDRVPALKLAVEQFNAVLDAQIRRLLKGVKRMPDPKESAIGLPAYWSVSSVENSPKHDNDIGAEATADKHELSVPLAKSASSSHAAGISCQSPKQRCSTDLDHLCELQIARTIKGHGSRSYDALSEHGMLETNPTICFGMACSDSVSRRIDFHDLELFLEVEHPATARFEIVRFSIPPHPVPDSLIDLDKLRTGQELMLESAENPAEQPNGARFVYLCNKNRSGKKFWWRISWKVGT